MSDSSFSRYSAYHCPRCGSTAYRESRRGWVRHLAKLIFLRKLRCIRCYGYFWRFSLRPAPPTPE